jgi:hypothetical protein
MFSPFASKIRQLSSPRVSSHKKKVIKFVVDPPTPLIDGSSSGAASVHRSIGMRLRSAGRLLSPGMKTRSMAFRVAPN